MISSKEPFLRQLSIKPTELRPFGEYAARQTNVGSQRQESQTGTSQRIEASGFTFHKDFETVQLLAPEPANDMQGSWSHSARCSHASGNPVQQNLLQMRRKSCYSCVLLQRHGIPLLPQEGTFDQSMPEQSN